jgi:hypothetical protein
MPTGIFTEMLDDISNKLIQPTVVFMKLGETIKSPDSNGRVCDSHLLQNIILDISPLWSLNILARLSVLPMPLLIHVLMSEGCMCLRISYTRLIEGFHSTDKSPQHHSIGLGNNIRRHTILAKKSWPVGIKAATMQLNLKTLETRIQTPFLNFINHWPPSWAQNWVLYLGSQLCEA